MFWYIVLAVVVVLPALAWWSSGRAKPLGRKTNHDPTGTDQASIAHRNANQFGNGPTGHGGGFGI